MSILIGVSGVIVMLVGFNYGTTEIVASGSALILFATFILYFGNNFCNNGVLKIF